MITVGAAFINYQYAGMMALRFTIGLRNSSKKMDSVLIVS